jgi:hypothetical protein
MRGVADSMCRSFEVGRMDIERFIAGTSTLLEEWKIEYLACC